MAGIYRQRHPERTIFYRVFFHYFERFLREYESRFEKEYGYLRSVIQEVVEKYLDCGNPMGGFARIRCPDCREERLLMFSCKTRGFCPSCHAKRREEWSEWMREELLLDVPHRQVVFTIPKMLRLFFRFRRSLLSSLCMAAVQALLKYFKAVSGQKLMPGIVEDHKVIDKIIGYLKLTFIAERGLGWVGPPPPQVAQHELLMAAEDRGEYF